MPPGHLYEACFLWRWANNRIQACWTFLINILSDEEEKTVGFTEAVEEKKIEKQRKAIETATKEFFASDFLNAFDQVLFFDPLTPGSVREIAEIEITGIRNRLQQRGIDLIVSPEVTDLVASRGFSSESGAHQLTRTVENMVLQPVSRFLMENMNAKRICLQATKKGIRVTSRMRKRSCK